MASTTEDETEIITPYTEAQETEIPDGAAAAAAATEEEANDYDDDDDVKIQHEREGHLCFGLLFDMRVGAILVNVANILLRIICIAFDISWGDLYPVGSPYCSLILSMIAIFSALYYEYLPAYLSAASFTAIAIVHMFGDTEWFAVIWDCLIIYPTVVMAYQIQRDILRKETYEARERYIDPSIRGYVEKLML